ncbi:MAG: 50S ribosomal protein L18 [Pelolinea sp.]|jgi:large subunit ribosomal protein L18|nr:50S ribosomal protein L18 [Pelolinea sp.]
MANKSRNEARLKRHRRVRKDIYGVAEKPRMCVFRSLSDIYVQVIDDDKGITLVSSSSLDKELKGKLKGKNKTEQAVEVGKLVAARAKEKKISDVVFDRGGYRFDGRVKALANAAREAGLKF